MLETVISLAYKMLGVNLYALFLFYVLYRMNFFYLNINS